MTTIKKSRRFGGNIGVIYYILYIILCDEREKSILCEGSVEL